VERTELEEGAEGLEWRRTGPQKVYQVLNKDWDQDRTPIVWCANPGWVDGNTVSWEALKARKAWKIYNTGTIFGEIGFRPGISKLALPEFADYLLLPDIGMTGEILTPYGIHDWNAVAQASGNWYILQKIRAPRGEILIYKNSIPRQKRDFKFANAWLKWKLH
jgi:hypothetical protein